MDEISKLNFSLHRISLLLVSQEHYSIHQMENFLWAKLINGVSPPECLHMGL